MRYTLILAMALVVAMLSACTTSPTGQAISEPALVIGIATPLTGPAASYGEKISAGARVAAAEYEAETGKKVTLLFEDTKCDPKTGVDAIQKLIRLDGVHAVTGIACSAVILPAATIAENEHTVLMGTATSNPDITNAGDYIFRIILTDREQGAAIATVIKEQSFRNIGIISVKDEYGMGLVGKIRENAGKTQLSTEQFEIKDLDFRSQLTKLIAKDPDALVIIAAPNQFNLIAQQARELGFTKQLIVDGNVGLVPEMNPALEGAITFDLYFNKEDPKTQWLIDESAKYGIEANWATALAYDSMRVLFAAADNCTPVTNECIKDELYKIKDFPGPSGNTTFDESGDVIGKTYNLVEIRDGKFVALEG